MRRGMWIGVALLVILALVGVGIGAYNAGLHQGIEDSDRAVEVVRVVGHGWGFPFGLILFPLFLIGIVLLVRGAFGRRHWGGPGHHGPGSGWGPGGGGGRAAMLEEWHRRMHGEGGGSPSGEPRAGGEPATA